MRQAGRVIGITLLAFIASVVIGVASMLGSAATYAATSALIMGGTGRPDPQDFPGYIPNVASYYIYPNTICQPGACELVSVFTPEEAFPLYGGLEALTWQDSILQGVEDLDDAVRDALQEDPNGQFVIFGYSQSGAIIAFEKRRLADDPTIDESQFEFVIIGNASRPNGGLNVRANGFQIPIVEFPFGPSTPTDTTMLTTDIAFKWDIIADAPLYVLNPIAMLNALMGFQYVHGTMPDPTVANPERTPGGYSVAEWQAIMNDPEAFAAQHPDLVNVDIYGDTRYITVTPKVLPLLQPLHDIGLQPLADLIEPALRVIIEETGYDRSIPYGVPTPFQLFPVFDPVELITKLIAAIPEGVQQALENLGGGSMLAPAGPAPSILADAPQSSSAAAKSAAVPLTEELALAPVAEESSTATTQAAPSIDAASADAASIDGSKSDEEDASQQENSDIGDSAETAGSDETPGAKKSKKEDEKTADGSKVDEQTSKPEDNSNKKPDTSDDTGSDSSAADSKQASENAAA